MTRRTVGFFTATPDGAVSEADAVFGELVGQTEPIGRQLAELVFPGDAEAAQWISELDQTGRRFVAHIEQGNTGLWLAITARRSESGIEGTVMDATDEREEIERYRIHNDQSPFGVVIIQDGYVVYANDAQEALQACRGRRVDEILEESMHPEDLRLVKERIAARQAGVDVPPHYRYRAIVNGETRWSEVWSSPVEYRGRPAVQAMSRDVTDQIRVEEQLRHAQKMEAIGRLAGGVAHDFNNLLTIIQASTLFAKRAPTLGQASAELEQVEQAAQRASELTRQLLLFSRRESNRPVVLDIGQALAGVQKMLNRLVGDNIKVEIKGADQPLFTRIDAGQLDQVVTNLVVNAKDAMPHGGEVTVEAGPIDFLASSPHPAGSYVMLSVRDSGAGISAEDLPKIFDPFFTTKGVGTGTGLGLSTVLGIIKEAGGFTDVESVVGSGTRVSVFLPVWSGPVPTEVAATAAADDRWVGSILVVEDDDAVRTVVTRTLEMAGLHAHEATGGAAALRMLRGGLDVDAIISDVLMPGMSGVELEKEVSENWPNIPVALVTGYADSEELPDDGRCTVLRKPFTPTELVELASKLVRTAKAAATKTS